MRTVTYAPSSRTAMAPCEPKCPHWRQRIGDRRPPHLLARTGRLNKAHPDAPSLDNLRRAVYRSTRSGGDPDATAGAPCAHGSGRHKARRTARCVAHALGAAAHGPHRRTGLPAVGSSSASSDRSAGSSRGNPNRSRRARGGADRPKRATAHTRSLACHPRKWPPPLLRTIYPQATAKLIWTATASTFPPATPAFRPLPRLR